MNQPNLSITGRQSSHFTRTARIYAEELGLYYQYRPIHDLMSRDPADYDGHPALKMPVLRVDGDPVYGTLNICRTLAGLAGAEEEMVWPETLPSKDGINAQELVLQAMATEVTLILSRLSGVEAGADHLDKARHSLTNSLDWLESGMPGLIDELPSNRRLSFLEVTLFCLIGHLAFREVLSVEPYIRLQAFADAFASRACARATAYRMDP